MTIGMHVYASKFESYDQAYSDYVKKVKRKAEESGADMNVNIACLQLISIGMKTLH